MFDRSVFFENFTLMLFILLSLFWAKMRVMRCFSSTLTLCHQFEALNIFSVCISSDEHVHLKPSHVQFFFTSLFACTILIKTNTFTYCTIMLQQHVFKRTQAWQHKSKSIYQAWATFYFACMTSWTFEKFMKLNFRNFKNQKFKTLVCSSLKPFGAKAPSR